MGVPSALFRLCGAAVRGFFRARRMMAVRSCGRHGRAIPITPPESILTPGPIRSGVGVCRPVPSSCWATCSGFSPELNGNDFEIDIIMCGVCISQWRFGYANEFRGRGQKRTDADRSGLRRTVSDGYGPKWIVPDGCGRCRTGER